MNEDEQFIEPMSSLSYSVVVLSYHISLLSLYIIPGENRGRLDSLGREADVTLHCSENELLLLLNCCRS